MKQNLKWSLQVNIFLINLAYLSDETIAMKYNLNTQQDSNPGCNLLGIMMVAGLYT